MDSIEEYKQFLDNIGKPEDKVLMESIKEAFNICLEAGLSMSNLGGTTSMDSSTKPTKIINNKTNTEPLSDEEKTERIDQDKKDSSALRRKSGALSRTFKNVAIFAKIHPEIVEQLFKELVKPAIQEGFEEMDKKLGTDTSGKSLGSRFKKAVGAFRGESIDLEAKALIESNNDSLALLDEVDSEGNPYLNDDNDEFGSDTVIDTDGDYGMQTDNDISSENILSQGDLKNQNKTEKNATEKLITLSKQLTELQNNWKSLDPVERENKKSMLMDELKNIQ